jgi:DNA-directed RNA polymerase specialized sigma24 family protein
VSRPLSTSQRAVLALHSERFQTRDIAEILGMKRKAVRKNLKEARATLKDSLDLNDNPRTGHGPSAGEPSAEGGAGHEPR